MKAEIGDCFKMVGAIEYMSGDEYVCHYYQQRSSDVLHVGLNNPDQPIINLLDVKFLRNSNDEKHDLIYELIEYSEFYLKIKQVIYILDIEEFWHKCN